MTWRLRGREAARLPRECFYSPYPVPTVSWPARLFASPSHMSVDSCEESVGLRGCVCAPSAGRQKPVFASPHVIVRQPLQRGCHTILRLSRLHGGLTMPSG